VKYRKSRVDATATAEARSPALPGGAARLRGRGGANADAKGAGCAPQRAQRTRNQYSRHADVALARRTLRRFAARDRAAALRSTTLLPRRWARAHAAAGHAAAGRDING
jgi:hypothetical protein